MFQSVIQCEWLTTVYNACFLLLFHNYVLTVHFIACSCSEIVTSECSSRNLWVRVEQCVGRLWKPKGIVELFLWIFTVNSTSNYTAVNTACTCLGVRWLIGWRCSLIDLNQFSSKRIITAVCTNIWSTRHTCVLWYCLRNAVRNWFNDDNPSENCTSRWCCNVWVFVMYCMSVQQQHWTAIKDSYLLK